MNIEFIKACGNNDIEKVKDWLDKCKEPETLDDFGHDNYYPYVEQGKKYKDVDVHGLNFVTTPDSPVSQLWLTDDICVDKSYDYGFLLACNNGYLDLVELLYRYGCGKVNQSALVRCCSTDFCRENPNTEVIKFLFENTDIHNIVEMNICIYHAVYSGCIDLLDFLHDYLQPESKTPKFYERILDGGIVKLNPDVLEWVVSKHDFTSCKDVFLFHGYTSEQTDLVCKMIAFLLTNIPTLRKTIIEANETFYKTRYPDLFERVSELLKN